MYFVVGILCFIQDLKCAKTNIFHSYTQCYVLSIGLFCCQASHNAPHSWKYKLIYFIHMKHTVLLCSKFTECVYVYLYVCVGVIHRDIVECVKIHNTVIYL